MPFVIPGVCARWEHTENSREIRIPFRLFTIHFCCLIEEIHLLGLHSTMHYAILET